MIFPSAEPADRAKLRNRGDKNRKTVQQLRSFLLAIAMSLTATVGAQEAMSASLHDQFALFTYCSRMNTLIDVQRSNSTPIQSVPTQDAVRRESPVASDQRVCLTTKKKTSFCMYMFML